MKVAYFSKYSDVGPSSRFRIFQFAASFRESGIELQIEPLFHEPYFEFLRRPPSITRNLRKSLYVLERFRERRKSLKRHRGADLVLIEHQLFPYMPFFFENQFLPERYLLEFDDAIYLTHPSKFPKLVRQAAAVVVGNAVLAEYARKYQQNVHIVPTVLNTEQFQPAPKPGRDRIVIGWSGLEYNFKYLQMIAPVLERLCKKFPVDVVVLSGSAPGNLHFPFRFEKWDGALEARQMNEFDIGIMPLEMDEWCRAKCGMKLLQYMSLQIPAVVTPVGVNGEIIRNEQNGFWATSPEEWEARLSQLLLDGTLRQRLGTEARKTVVEHYSLQRWFPVILDIYRKYAN